jgi:hypothetical protein
VFRVAALLSWLAAVVTLPRRPPGDAPGPLVGVPA